jgi:putative transposase
LASPRLTRYITYPPLVGGCWCYLATWRDTCPRRIASWHLNQQMPTELVPTALEQAATLRRPATSLIIHADRGSQYTSLACRVTPITTPRLGPVEHAQTALLPHGGAFANVEEAYFERDLLTTIS